MKSCRTCGRTYYDDALNFCLDDGTQLSFFTNQDNTVGLNNALDDSPPSTEVFNSELARSLQPTLTDLPSEPNVRNERPLPRRVRMKVCMLGASAVGKTSLVSRYVSGQFSDKYLTTVGAKVDRKVVRVGEREVHISLWDIEGADNFQKIRTSFLEGASGFMLVVDGTRRQTFEVAMDIRRQLEDEFGSTPLVMLVFNKSDLSDQWEIHDSDIEYLASQGINVIKGSAKTGMGVEDAFYSLTIKMLNDWR
jgi:small GTP-binding protein